MSMPYPTKEDDVPTKDVLLEKSVKSVPSIHFKTPSQAASSHASLVGLLSPIWKEAVVDDVSVTIVVTSVAVLNVASRVEPGLFDSQIDSASVMFSVSELLERK